MTFKDRKEMVESMKKEAMENSHVINSVLLYDDEIQEMIDAGLKVEKRGPKFETGEFAGLTHVHVRRG